MMVSMATPMTFRLTRPPVVSNEDMVLTPPLPHLKCIKKMISMETLMSFPFQRMIILGRVNINIIFPTKV